MIYIPASQRKPGAGESRARASVLHDDEEPRTLRHREKQCTVDSSHAHSPSECGLYPIFICLHPRPGHYLSLADAIIYMVARHWKPTEGGSAEYTQNGWYENSFARIDGEWKITRLLHTYQWISGNGALFDFSDPELIQVMGEVCAEQNRVAR